jgi:acyl transferase domain-containing protein/pimeloyl-ACP methyl ester carboxylesterase/acyl carrier protein
MAESTLIISGGAKGVEPIVKTFAAKELESDRAIAANQSEPGSITLVGCGQNLLGQKLVIANPETLTSCQDGEIGEIWSASNSVARGYWNRQEQTEETFGAYLVDTGEGPFLRTGDLGFLNDGELFVTGRLKDLIIIRGRNHYPQDLELTVDSSNPAVRAGAGAAFAVEVEGEERLVITQEIQRTYLRNLDADRVISDIRKAIVQNHELQPYAVVLLKTGSIPKTSSGKIQRHACKRKFLKGSLHIVGQWQEQGAGSREQGAGSREQGAEEQRSRGELLTTNSQQPTTSIQQQSIQNWLVSQLAERLGIPAQEIDIREPLANYGLDSVQAVRLSAELEDWLGVKLSPTLVYDYPDIFSLAEYLASLKGDRENIDHPVPNTDCRLPITSQEIAIVGIGCRFPGAKNPQEFWELLHNGKDAISQVKEERWQGNEWGGFLERVDQFDPQFFGISPRETQRMDPQQRLLLEVSWEALEHAGIAPEKLARSATGVFMGISSSDYSQLQLHYGVEIDAYAGTGNAHSIAANRISYFFDFKGPSLTVDTACSSSLVAVHLACQSLKHGECDRAIVGGVNLMLSPELNQTFSQAGMMAADGRCKTFDASADGYVRGEGCGVIVLKRLDDAIEDRDNILAVIEGSAINQDGRSNGLTAPNGLSQQAVVRQALKNAGVEPSAISYIEAHGTGTSLGDPIEINSLKNVLMENRQAKETCYIGSVKTNIGHLEAAAGIAGLIKTVLGLVNQEIPPHLHLQQLNPHIDLENSAIAIPTQPQAWLEGDKPRLAGVSSFGFGGTNAHVVVGEFIIGNRERGTENRDLLEIRNQKSKARSQHILTLSAKNEKALVDLVKNYAEFVTNNPELNLADVCFTANTGRTHFSHRLSVIADSSQQLREKLNAFLEEGEASELLRSPVPKNSDLTIAWLFTGQGSQYEGMGYELYQTQPIFRNALDRCAEILQPYLEKSLIEIIYPKEGNGEQRHSVFRGNLGIRALGTGNNSVGANGHASYGRTTFTQGAESGGDEIRGVLGSFSRRQVSDHYKAPPLPTTNNQATTNLLDETEYTQPALFALEYALAQLWLSWGIQPSVVMGHSVGEYVAATIAGVFTLEDGLKLIAHRARLMQTLCLQGKMVAVFDTETQVTELIESLADKISIAAINSPQNIVISGETEAIEEAIAQFDALDIKTRQLNVSHAFHSPLMKPMLAEFAKVASEITYSLPQIEIVSNVTGQIAAAEIATPEYWVDHILKPVRFSPSIELVSDRGCDIFLEIGAKPILLGMGRQCLPKLEGLWLPSLRPRKEDWEQILQSLAALYIRGFDLDWSGFDRPYQRQRINSLPTYPFQRERYWLEVNPDRKNSSQEKLFARPSSANKPLDFYQVNWQQKQLTSNLQNHNSDKNCWIIFGDCNNFFETLRPQLTKTQQEYILISDTEEFNLQEKKWKINGNRPEDWQKLFEKIASINLNRSIKGIIYLGCLDDPNSEELNLANLEKIQQKNCTALLQIIQNLFNRALSIPIWLVTRGTQALEPTDKPEIAQSSLWGLGNVIAIEHPECWGGIVDLASQANANEANLLLTAITNSEKEDRIAIRNEQTYVGRLKKSQKSVVGAGFVDKFSLETNNLFAKPARTKVKSQKSSYLITGGLGALGLKLARWLVEQGARNLVLVGRSHPDSEAKGAIADLEQKGVTIFVAQADVSVEADVVKVLEESKASLPPIAGIIHAAGVLDDGILIEQNWERFRNAIAPKVFGAWNLHNLTQDLSLDFFVTFSSIASLIGSPGQANYAAANAFLDAIARYRQAQGLPGLSINWGPWAETGMAVKANFNRQGLNLIETELGLQALGQLLTSNATEVGVLSVDWNELSKQFPYLLQSPFFENLVNNRSLSQTESTQQQSNIFARSIELPSDRREAFLLSYLQSAIAKILQIEPEQIATTDSLLDLGMDSLMVMEAINQLKGDLQLMIYPREFYERPKIDALAKYLSVEFEKTHLGIYDSAIEEKPAPAIEQPKPTTNYQLPTTNKKLPGAVFILSSPRSGSTLLRVMLAGHPALYSPPELHLLPFETMGQRNEELGVSQLGQGLQRAFMELKNIDATESQQLIDRLVEENLSVQDVYGMLQQLAGDRILVDKSPTYANNREILERGEQLFADAKYIHLVRHPYAVIESFARMRMDKLVSSGNSNPYKLAESIWTNSNQNTLEFFEAIDPKRHYLVQYEALVTEPQKVMEGVCKFLNLDFDPAVLKPYEGDRMTDGVHDRSMSVGDPNFLKRDRIDAKLAETWRDIKLPKLLGGYARQVARNLNYELPKEETNANTVSASSMREISIEIRGLKLCLCSWGPEEGPLVLCLHGILEQGAAWSEVAIRLAQQGYRVIAPDLRGHGRSAHVGKGGSYNLLDFLADIDAIVENIADRAFTLVGHSLGSVVAAIFTSIRPQKVLNLILVETVLPTETDEDEAAEQLATHLDYLASPQEHPVFPDVATAADRLRQATPALSKPLAMMLAERITEPCEGGVRWRWAALLRTRAGIGFNGISQSKYLGLLKRIRVPITLIYGDNSNFNRQEDLSQQQTAMPKAEKIVLPGGHNLHLEAPSALAKIIGGAKALTNKLIPES